MIKQNRKVHPPTNINETDDLLENINLTKDL